MSKLDDSITALQAQVANDTAVETSAIALINGIAARIQAAVDAALAAGASPTQLQALTDLGTALNTSSAALAAAVTANTPTPPPPPGP